MPECNQVRLDHMAQPLGGMAAVWGIRGGTKESLVREYLAAVYSIPPKGRRVTAKHAYEFSLFMLEGSVSIDFNKSMFNQPTLRPVVPAATAFQIEAPTEDEALTLVTAIVNILKCFESDVDIQHFNDWIAVIPSIKLIKQSEKTLQPA